MYKLTNDLIINYITKEITIDFHYLAYVNIYDSCHYIYLFHLNKRLTLNKIVYFCYIIISISK